MAQASIKHLLTNYIVENHLAKTACLTNCLPSREEAEGLIGSLSYICFCMPSYPKKIEALFLAYFCGYRSIDYDVITARIEDGMLKRQFGYLCFQVNNPSHMYEIVNFATKHKRKINRNYPVLVRFICTGFEYENSTKSNMVCKTKLRPNDVIFEVN